MEYGDYIKNLTCEELIMKIVQSSFIHRFVHFTHKYYALKTHLIHKFLFHPSTHLSVCQMCFQCIILMHEIYELQMKKNYTIFITKS
jgi:hypothetical protein